MIYVTGDLHGNHDMYKLNVNRFPQQKTMTKNDYVIIAGDAGLVWDNSPEEHELQSELSDRNFTTLWVCGNHENFDLLGTYPIEEWNGGKVHFITDSIIHLCRGQVFDIDGVKIFTFGGATSIDKASRKLGTSWWKEEMPSEEECEEGLKNLAAHNWEVDYIITHECSDLVFNKLIYRIFAGSKPKTTLSNFLGKVEERAVFKKWFFGHYHDDVEVDEKHTLLYNKLVRIV